MLTYPKVRDESLGMRFLETISPLFLIEDVQIRRCLFGVGGIDGCHDNVTSLNWCAVLTEGRLLGFEGSQAVGDGEDHLPILSDILGYGITR